MGEADISAEGVILAKYRYEGSETSALARVPTPLTSLSAGERASPWARPEAKIFRNLVLLSKPRISNSNTSRRQPKLEQKKELLEKNERFQTQRDLNTKYCVRAQLFHGVAGNESEKRACQALRCV